MCERGGTGGDSCARGGLAALSYPPTNRRRAHNESDRRQLASAYASARAHRRASAHARLLCPRRAVDLRQAYLGDVVADVTEESATCGNDVPLAPLPPSPNCAYRIRVSLKLNPDQHRLPPLRVAGALCERVRACTFLV